jgi:hypothetical protein
MLQGMGWNVNEMLFKEGGAWPHTPINVLDILNTCFSD